MKDIKKIQEFFSKPVNEKKETAVDMAKKQLDALGVKYELGDKFRPFKAIYKPTDMTDDWYDDFDEIIYLFNLGSAVKRAMNEAKEEDKVDTITMDIPLFLRMLEYSREDAAQDVDLHDVTEKATSLGKERGILQMDDYAEIVGAAEDAPKSEMNEAELTEANIPSNIRDFAKRKGVLPLVNKVAKWAEAVGARIAGGTAIGKNYSTLVLDLDYKQQGEVRIDTDYDTITLFDEPVTTFKEFQRVYSDGQGFNLEEIASKIISKLKESKSTPCWKGYEQIGMKEKDGRQVPNCVPKK